MTSRNIPQLQQLTTYEWQIKHFVTQQISRILDGPTRTHSQQPRLYHLNLNPSILPIISNTTCNQNTGFFSIIAQQQPNEPDISTSIFFSDKGYFDMNNINSGDTLGNASPIVVL